MLGMVIALVWRVVAVRAVALPVALLVVLAWIAPSAASRWFWRVAPGIAQSTSLAPQITGTPDHRHPRSLAPRAAGRLQRGPLTGIERSRRRQALLPSQGRGAHPPRHGARRRTIHDLQCHSRKSRGMLRLRAPRAGMTVRSFSSLIPSPTLKAGRIALDQCRRLWSRGDLPHEVHAVGRCAGRTRRLDRWTARGRVPCAGPNAAR